MPGVTSSYSILTHFLYLFTRIELNPHSETMGMWMVFAFSILYMSFGIYQFIQGYKKEKDERFQKERAEKLKDLDKAIEHYRTLVENSNDIIYKADLQGNITYVNPVASKIMGYSEEMLLGKNYLDLIRLDYRPIAEEFYTNQIQAGTDTTYFEFPAIAKNGKEIWFGQNVQLLKEGERIVGVQAVARDISARRGAEQKLKSNEELFQQFVKYTPAAVAMFDREMRYLAVSDRWVEDFHIEDDQVLGQSYYDLSPGMPDEWEEIHQSCLTGVSHKCEEEPFQREDGSVEWLQWEVHPWYDVPGEVGGLIMFKELVTRRKHAEETLLKAKELAEETSRTKSNFIARMSHELRTPLTSILGYAQMLEIETGLTRGQLDQVEQIKVSGEYLLEIINDLLELSDYETGKIEFEGGNLDLHGLLNEIVAQQSAKYSNNKNRHRIDIPEQLPAGIYTDTEKLKTILENLINNAFKFTEDGMVTVTSKITAVEGSGADGLLVITVSDTGPGIPAEKGGTIFQPFSQVTERYNQGTGLGLALAQKFCRFLGGTLEAQSEVGKGSSFTVKIPVQKQEYVERFPAEDFTEPSIETGNGNEEISVREVSNFIQSLDNESIKIIREALELQDLDTISQIDSKLGLPESKRNGALKKLKASAENYDYLFITNISRELLS